jgi:hypothetical protein
MQDMICKKEPYIPMPEGRGFTAVSVRKSLPKVRLAVREDLNEVISLGRDLHFENGLMSLSDEAIIKIATDAIDGTNGIIGVIGAPGHIEGLIILQFRRFQYSDADHLEEIGIYVKPQYRRSYNAKSMIEFAKEAAVRIGIPLLIGVLSTHQTEAKVRLYQRSLGKPAGVFFLFNGKTGKARS